MLIIATCAGRGRAILPASLPRLESGRVLLQPVLPAGTHVSVLNGACSQGSHYGRLAEPLVAAAGVLAAGRTGLPGSVGRAGVGGLI